MEDFNQLPHTRSAFERVMHLTYEMNINGQLHLTPGTGERGLGKVRYLPNSRIDLLTINESARLIANMVGNKDQMIVNEEKSKNEQQSDTTTDEDGV